MYMLMLGVFTRSELVDRLEASMDEGGLDVVNPGYFHGCYARVRRVELAAALNRLRTLRVAGRQ